MTSLVFEQSFIQIIYLMQVWKVNIQRIYFIWIWVWEKVILKWKSGEVDYLFSEKVKHLKKKFIFQVIK